jgi:hypothetical protein
MGKPLVRFWEGPGFNEGLIVRGIRHVVVACDEAFHESLIEHLINDHSKTSVYSKVLVKPRVFWLSHYSNTPLLHSLILLLLLSSLLRFSRETQSSPSRTRG